MIYLGYFLPWTVTAEIDLISAGKAGRNKHETTLSMNTCNRNISKSRNACHRCLQIFCSNACNVYFVNPLDNCSQLQSIVLILNQRQMHWDSTSVHFCKGTFHIITIFSKSQAACLVDTSTFFWTVGSLVRKISFFSLIVLLSKLICSKILVKESWTSTAPLSGPYHVISLLTVMYMWWHWQTFHWEESKFCNQMMPVSILGAAGENEHEAWGL